MVTENTRRRNSVQAGTTEFWVSAQEDQALRILAGNDSGKSKRNHNRSEKPAGGLELR